MTEIGATVATAADGTRLSVIDRGSGEPFLLIPGLGYAAWSFTRQLEPLASAARVLAMDNRGTGHSDKPAGPYSITQMADDAFAVLSERGASPAHVVGTSMGGYIALMLALRHPRAVRSLVLVASTSGGTGLTGGPQRDATHLGSGRHLGRPGGLRPRIDAVLLRSWLGRSSSE